MKVRYYSRKAFTLTEILISMTLMTIVAGMFYGAMTYFNVTQKTYIYNVLALQRAQKSVAYLSKDMEFAFGVDILNLPLTAGYSNSASTLCIYLPSIDADGNIIVEDGAGVAVPLGTYRDYMYFYLDGTSLKREVIVDPLAPAPVGRANGVFTLAENVKSVTFGQGATTLDALSSSDLNALRTVQITLVSEFQAPMGKIVTKTLTTRVLFRNKL